MEITRSYVYKLKKNAAKYFVNNVSKSFKGTKIRAEIERIYSKGNDKTGKTDTHNKDPKTKINKYNKRS